MSEIKITKPKSVIITKEGRQDVETDLPKPTAKALQNMAKAKLAKAKLKEYKDILLK